MKYKDLIDWLVQEYESAIEEINGQPSITPDEAYKIIMDKSISFGICIKIIYSDEFSIFFDKLRSFIEHFTNGREWYCAFPTEIYHHQDADICVFLMVESMKNRVKRLEQVRGRWDSIDLPVIY